MVTVFVHLNRESGRTLQQQLVGQMREAITARRLPPGARLPATRLFATELGISRNVVVAAFEELTSEGYLEGRVGSGTYVASDLPDIPVRQPESVVSVLPQQENDTAPQASAPASAGRTIDFLNLGNPAIMPLPLAVWRGMWREVTEQLPPADYGPAAGDPELRAAIAAYLARARGVTCGPEEIIITAGAAEALALLLRLTLAPGARAAIEEPGYGVARLVLRLRQARIAPIPVDDNGLCVDRLPVGPDAPALVYVTPSHQYPLGVRLPVARRLALLAWAEAHNSLIVEDDYDSEFRYDAPPLPAMAGLDTRGRVAYIGTFSKVLTPALRVGYLVLPPPLRKRISPNGALRLGLNPTPWPVQRALAQFIISGELERHIRRMRRQYAAKRAALTDAMIPIRSVARLQGLDAGLHAYLDLCPEIAAADIIARAEARGVLVEDIRWYYHGEPDRNGLLLGYGGLDVDAISRGARILAEVIANRT
jgi:GntR family transcriptional regulator/MocR family aminotransferase